ncbi:MAG TPA: hypothetical protein VN897_10900, partial [Mycobacterium sp.]|nr:hypothetical protein [Mycobacterium sp.]
TGQQVVLSTQPGAPFLTNFDTVTITEPDGQTVLSSQTLNSNVGQQFLQTGLLTLPETGTYSAQFVPSGPATGDVTMQLGAPVTGTIAVGGPVVTTSTTSAGDAIILSFSGVAGQTVELLVQPSSSFFAFFDNVTIIEPDGETELLSQSTNPNVGQQSLLTSVLVLPETGSYTLQFSPSGPAVGAVSMTLFDAGTSSLGATDFTATIPTPGATAQLAFSGNAGSRVSLLTVADSNLRQGCFTISLTAPGATTALYSNTQSSFSDFSQALTLPASGLYTMLLVPCGNATGNAALTLFDVPPDATGSTMIGGTAASLTTVVPGQGAQVSLPVSAANQTANVAVTADANFSSSCYTVTVTGPNGTLINTGQGCGTGYSTGVLNLGAAGTYNIAVASVSTAVGNVTVGVTVQ